MAIRELQELPEPLVWQVLELRAYARTKAALDAATREEDAPTGPMAEWVWRVQNHLLQQQRARRAHGR